MSDVEARAANVGGEVLCHVFKEAVDVSIGKPGEHPDGVSVEVNDALIAKGAPRTERRLAAGSVGRRG